MDELGSLNLHFHLVKEINLVGLFSHVHFKWTTESEESSTWSKGL